MENTAETSTVARKVPPRRVRKRQPTKSSHVAMFFLLGLAAMLPWNTLITEVQYFTDRLCGTSREDDYLNIFILTYLSCEIVGALAVIFLVKYIGEKSLVVFPLSKTAVGFSVLALFTVLPDLDFKIFFGFTMWVVILSGLIKSMFVSGCASLASKFPPSLMGWFLSGMAAGGVVTSLSSLITTSAVSIHDQFCAETSSSAFEACRDIHPAWNTFAYFLFSALISAFGMFSYKALEHGPLGKVSETGGQTQPKVGDETEVESQASNEEADTAQVEVIMASFEFGGLGNVLYFPRYYLASVMLSMMITFVVFPTITSGIQSERRCRPGVSRLFNDLFTPLLFLIYNAFDMLGRMVAGHWAQMRGQSVLLLTLSRSVLIPLILFCNVQGSSLPVVFERDGFPLLFLAMLGFSNGFVLCQCFNGVPLSVPKSQQKLSATVTVLYLTLGLLVGSTISYLMTGVVKE